MSFTDICPLLLYQQHQEHLQELWERLINKLINNELRPKSYFVIFYWIFSTVLGV